MDNSVEAIVRDTKIIVISVFALLGSGIPLLLFVTAFPRLAFFGTVLLGIFGLIVLLLLR